MASPNKTISINLSSFKKNKTKRKMPKQIAPIISSNVFKNKLLHRIKQHKNKEQKDIRIVEKMIGGKREEEGDKDDFLDSMNYLQSLTNEHKQQQQREELERKTIKNHHAMSVNVDLPLELELMEQPQSMAVSQDAVPYGILKGGVKPTYKEWSKTQKNNIVTNPNLSLVIPSTNSTDREKRLNLLKQKIKQLDHNNVIHNNNAINNNNNAINNNAINNNAINNNNTINNTINNNAINNNNNAINNTLDNNVNEHKLVATKHITKKTIKRKYTLGKSKIKKSVGIMIKDKHTRKKVLQAQKELKQKNMSDVKSYLKEHNLIKIGSHAPNDVLRKMYESSMLAGEITNSNPDNLIHNLSKEEM
jgi:hypothetical protein